MVDEQPDEIQESEESIEDLKMRLAKAERDKDLYKNDLLAIKRGKRNLDSSIETPPKKEYVEKNNEFDETDITEERILNVLYKQNEREALQNITLPSHPDYIPELVDDLQYNEIINYLPRNIDKKSSKGIVRALRTAVVAWKHDRGLNDTNNEFKKGKRQGLAEARVKDLTSTNNNTISGSKNFRTPPKGERKILKKASTPQTWYT